MTGNRSAFFTSVPLLRPFDFPRGCGGWAGVPKRGNNLCIPRRTCYDGAKRRRGSKIHAAVDTLGHLLAVHVTPASLEDRAHVGELAEAVQEVTGETVELAYVDAGYTGNEPAQVAASLGMRLEVVKLPEAKRGFVLLQRQMGGGAQFLLDDPLSSPGSRRRTLPRDVGWSSRIGFCRAHASSLCSRYGSCFISSQQTLCGWLRRRA